MIVAMCTSNNTYIILVCLCFLFAATAYGDGVYFAKDAKYAARDQYSPRDSRGHKHMYLAKVLTGEYTKGRSGMKEPPAKDPT